MTSGMSEPGARALVAVDGSDFSLDAARRGLALLGAGASPTLLMVVQPPPMVVPVAGGGSVPLIEQPDGGQLEEARAEVAAAAAAIGGDPPTRVEWGEPGATICAVAESEAFDVIVVGSHGAGWIKRLVVGSVSSYVVNHSPCPVLVVRQ